MRGALLAMFAGCGYHAGSFESWGHEFRGRHATVGCVDVAIAPRLDDPVGPVLAYDFGNGCDRPVVIDLGSAQVVARTGAGDVAMLPYDPHHELRALSLDARSVGAEAIAYRMDDRDARPSVMCVDVASIVVTTPATWQCFDRPGVAP